MRKSIKHNDFLKFDYLKKMSHCGILFISLGICICFSKSPAHRSKGRCSLLLIAADRCFVMVLRRTGQSTGLCAVVSGSGSFSRCQICGRPLFQNAYRCLNKFVYDQRKHLCVIPMSGSTTLLTVAACLAMVCLHYKGSYHHPPARYDGYRPERHEPLLVCRKPLMSLGFTTAAVRVDRENFLSDFSLPALRRSSPIRVWPTLWSSLKKTTIKDDGERRRHMLKEAEAAKEDEKNGKNTSARIMS